MLLLYQVKFSHAELIGKHEKVNKLKTEMLHEESIRNEHLRAAKEAILVRRQRVSQRQAEQDSLCFNNNSSVLEHMKHMLQDFGEDLDFFVKIERLFDKKCSDLDQERVFVAHENRLLRKRIGGYEAYIGRKDPLMIG